MFGWQVNEAADGTKVIKIKWGKKSKCGAELLVQLTESPIKPQNDPLSTSPLSDRAVWMHLLLIYRYVSVCVQWKHAHQSNVRGRNSIVSPAIFSSPLVPYLNTIWLSKQKDKKDRGGEEKKKTGDDGTIDLLHVEQFGARALDKQSLVKSSQSCA